MGVNEKLIFISEFPYVRDYSLEPPQQCPVSNIHPRPIGEPPLPLPHSWTRVYTKKGRGVVGKKVIV